MDKNRGTLRMGMVGGGPGALIGKIHRIAARMDGEVELAAGVFSRDFKKTQQTGKELHLDPARCYTNFEEMVKQESLLPEDRRIDFVSVVTPNNTHFPISRRFLESGFHVVCDKPMTFTSEEAEELVKVVKKTGKIFCLTHNYTGFSLVRHARYLCTGGQLGTLRKVMVEYLSGGMGDPIENRGSKQAAWRVDPSQAGKGGTLGDIGSHAFNLLEFITGEKVSRLCVDKTSFVDGRLLDDDANALLQMEGGGKGSLLVSQVATGEENALAVRIYGSRGSLRWHQEEPMKMDFFLKGEPRRILTPGHPYLSDAANEVTRTPPGLPEAYLEAFANIYRGALAAIRRYKEGNPMKVDEYQFPTVYDGLRGMRFISKAVESAERGSVWIDL